MLVADLHHPGMAEHALELSGVEAELDGALSPPVMQRWPSRHLFGRGALGRPGPEGRHLRGPAAGESPALERVLDRRTPRREGADHPFVHPRDLGAAVLRPEPKETPREPASRMRSEAW